MQRLQFNELRYRKVSAIKSQYMENSVCVSHSMYPVRRDNDAAILANCSDFSVSHGLRSFTLCK
jgi:hypothetical protein